jgi:hypothetical protein
MSGIFYFNISSKLYRKDKWRHSTFDGRIIVFLF